MYEEAISVSAVEKIETQTGNLNMSEIQLPELEKQYGTISCQRISLSAPIYYGDSDGALENGVGHYPNGNLPGKGRTILISGHDATYFASLEKVKRGDLMTITTDYGQFEYIVTSLKILDHTDTKAYDLNQEKEELILYTCYPFGQLVGKRSLRFFVYCKPVDKVLTNSMGGNGNDIG